MKCRDFGNGDVCYTDASGAKRSLFAHFTYATNAAGKPIIESVHYTDAKGDVVDTTGGTVTEGQCVLTEVCSQIGTVQLVADGSFDAVGGGGNIFFNWTIAPAAFETGAITGSGGAATWPPAGPYSSSISQPVTLEVGKTYRLSFTMSADSGVGVSLGGNDLTALVPVAGTNTVDFVCTDANPTLEFASGFFTTPFSLDNVSLLEIVEFTVPVFGLTNCTVGSLAGEIAAAMQDPRSSQLGCYNGTPVVVHYTYEGTSQSAPMVLITDLSGAPVPGATVSNVALGECPVEVVTETCITENFGPEKILNGEFRDTQFDSPGSPANWVVSNGGGNPAANPAQTDYGLRFGDGVNSFDLYQFSVDFPSSTYRVEFEVVSGSAALLCFAGQITSDFLAPGSYSWEVTSSGNPENVIVSASSSIGTPSIVSRVSIREILSDTAVVVPVTSLSSCTIESLASATAAAIDTALTPAVLTAVFDGELFQGGAPGPITLPANTYSISVQNASSAALEVLLGTDRQLLVPFSSIDFHRDPDREPPFSTTGTISVAYGTIGLMEFVGYNFKSQV